MASFTMTAGDDTITGTDWGDTFGQDGVGGGTDVIHGGAGSDRLYILEGTVHVTYYGEDGDDQLALQGFIADGIFDGGDGDDVVEARSTSLGTMTFVNVEQLTAFHFYASIAQLMSFSSLAPDMRSDYDIHLSGEGGNLDLLSRVDTSLDILFDASALTSGVQTTGGSGNDTFGGSAYADTLYGNGGNDQISGGNGNDSLNGDAGNDTLRGDAGDDTLNGGDGADTFYGGSGTNTLNGGDGDDTFVMDGSNSGGTIDGGDGWDTISGTTLGNATFTNVEELVSSHGFSISFDDLSKFAKVSVDYIWLIGAGGTLDLTGKSYPIDGTKLESAIIVNADPERTIVTGTRFADTFNGGAGWDTFTGGDGTDTLNGGAGNDSLLGVGRDADGNEIDQGTDVLNGGDGDDRLQGMGSDVMNGEAGDDLLIIGGENLAAAVDGGTGKDTVLVGGDLGSTTFVNVEMLQTNLITASLEQLNAFSTILTLTTATLVGAGGMFDLTGKLVDVSGVTLDGLALTSAIELTAGEDDDRLVGSQYDDTLRGGEGADVIEGGGGTDIAIYSGARANYSVTKAADGTVTITDTRSGTHDGQDTLTGVETARFSDGTLDLRDMAPVSLALSKATIAENSKVGTTIGALTAVDPEGAAIHYILTDDAGGLFKLVGNRLVTAKAIDYETTQKDTVTVQASDGVNTVSATYTIHITDMAETITGTAKAETVRGGIGADVIRAGAGNDKLYGYAGNDILKGEGGNDTLYTGAGADDLYGGKGRDVFLFRSVSDSTVSVSGRDTIFDFTHGDRIDLSGIDANPKSGDQAFSFIGTADYHGRAGELRYESTKSGAYIQGDVDGDRKADFSIHLDDRIVFDKGDFIL